MTKAEKDLLLYLAYRESARLGIDKQLLQFIKVVKSEMESIINHVHDFSYRQLTDIVNSTSSHLYKTGQCECGRSQLSVDYETKPFNKKDK